MPVPELVAPVPVPSRPGAGPGSRASRRDGAVAAAADGLADRAVEDGDRPGERGGEGGLRQGLLVLGDRLLGLGHGSLVLQDRRRVDVALGLDRQLVLGQAVLGLGQGVLVLGDGLLITGHGRAGRCWSSWRRSTPSELVELGVSSRWSSRWVVDPPLRRR